MDDLKRREFLKLGGAAVVAGATPLARTSRPVDCAERTVQRAADRDGANRLRRDRRPGSGPRPEPAEDSRLPDHRRLRHPARAHRLGDEADHRRRPSGADRLHPRPARLRAAVRDRGRSISSTTRRRGNCTCPIMLAAMKNGKHTATEVPAAMTVDDCWAIVEAAEKHQKHCVLMENCNYDRMEMMVYNMVRQGLFGEILHAEGGYLHDLRVDQVRRQGRRAVAPRVGDEGERQPLSDARPRAGRQLPRHQSRRSLRLSRVDERPVARAAGLGGRARAGGLAEAPGAVRARRRQRQPDQDRAAAGRSSSSTAPTCRGPTAASTWCRARRACSRAIRTASTSKDAARQDQWQEARPMLAEFEHPLWKEIAERGRRAPATAAWTSSRTTA